MRKSKGSNLYRALNSVKAACAGQVRPPSFAPRCYGASRLSAELDAARFGSPR